jgi:hypothetical protein
MSSQIRNIANAERSLRSRLPTLVLSGACCEPCRTRPEQLIRFEELTLRAIGARVDPNGWILALEAHRADEQREKMSRTR